MNTAEARASDRGWAKHRSVGRWVSHFVRNVFSNPLRPLLVGAFLLLIAFFISSAGGEIAEGEPADAWSVLRRYLGSVDLWHDFVRDVGISLIVASVIAYAIEKKASEERRNEFISHIREISEKTLESYFKRELPEGWVEFFMESIRSARFIRNDLNVKYSIRFPNQEERKKLSENFVILQNETSYKVTNITELTDDLKVSVFIERPVQMELFDLMKLHFIEIDSIKLSPSEIDHADKKWPDTRLCKRYTHQIKLSPGATIEVKLRFSTPKYLRDVQTWSNLVPATALQFTVEVEAGITAFIAAGHPAANVDDEVVVAGGRETVSIRRPVPAHAMVELAWMPSEMAEKLLGAIPIRPPQS
jgi:hypothetical protein